MPGLNGVDDKFFGYVRLLKQAHLLPLRGWEDRVVDNRVKCAISLMKTDFPSRDCTIGTIAARLQISTSLLRQLFARDLGHSPSRHLKELRLAHAEQLLVTENILIKEVTARVGINDVSHFVRDFQSRFKLSPSKYRRLIRTGKCSP